MLKEEKHIGDIYSNVFARVLLCYVEVTFQTSDCKQFHLSSQRLSTCLLESECLGLDSASATYKLLDMVQITQCL